MGEKKMIGQEYESPEVVSFGELDFEPTNIPVVCTTLVVCSAQLGHCTAQVTIVD